MGGQDCGLILSLCRRGNGEPSVGMSQKGVLVISRDSFEFSSDGCETIPVFPIECLHNWAKILQILDGLRH